MKFYKIEKKALAFVESHKACREELRRTMNVSDRALDYHIQNNLPNGSLTKYFALSIIAKYMDKPIESLVTETKLTREVA